MFLNEHGLPKPRHSYIHVPQPGRRGVLIHNGQIPNGAQPSGVVGGGFGVGGAIHGGVMPGAVLAGGLGYCGGFHGVYRPHTTPVYYGPNVATSTYSANYYNYPAYGYYSPYANLNYGFGGGLYANYYHPYQRSYYYPTTAAAPVVSYGYQSMPATTTYTVTNSHFPMTAPIPTTTTYHASGATRTGIQEENRRVAMARGAYSARRIKPSDALPDDPFWCRERTGEWHLRTFYQIENECYPGQWTMDAERGFLLFERH